MTHTTAIVLQSLAGGQRYGFEIMEATGLPGGTVYPILRRLEEAGCVDAGWEDAAAAHARRRPPRRYYDINDTGQAALVDAANRFPFIARSLAEPRA